MIERIANGIVNVAAMIVVGMLLSVMTSGQQLHLEIGLVEPAGERVMTRQIVPKPRGFDIAWQCGACGTINGDKRSDCANCTQPKEK